VSSAGARTNALWARDLGDAPAATHHPPHHPPCGPCTL